MRNRNADIKKALILYGCLNAIIKFHKVESWVLSNLDQTAHI